MTELHYGRLPKAKHLLEQIRRSHQLGFRTILLDEYQILEAQGVHLEDFYLFVEVASVPDLSRRDMLTA
jgi:hypothetical protein